MNTTQIDTTRRRLRPEVAVDQAPLKIGNAVAFATDIGYDGGYFQLHKWIVWDRGAQSVTLGPRSYGDPVALPWMPPSPQQAHQLRTGPTPK